MDIGSITVDSYRCYGKDDVNDRSDELKIGDQLYFGRDEGESSMPHWVAMGERSRTLGSILYEPIIHPKLSFNHETIELAQFGIEIKEGETINYRYWLPETEKGSIDDRFREERNHLLTAGITVNRDQYCWGVNPQKPLLFYLKLTPNWQAAADERVVNDLDRYDSGLNRCTFRLNALYVGLKFQISAKSKPITEEEAREFAQANQPQFKDDLNDLIKILMKSAKKHPKL